MEEVEKLKKDNERLEKENKELKEKLSKYTNPERLKRFYENNRTMINEKRRDYSKEYSKEYYKRKKEEK